MNTSPLSQMIDASGGDDAADSRGGVADFLSGVKEVIGITFFGDSMNGPTIQMEKDVAVAKLEEYELAISTRPEAATITDRAILQGYRVLARGGRLVDVNDAIRHAGLNLAGIPKLAISRAHVEQTHWLGGSSRPRFIWGGAERRPFDARYHSDNYTWNLSPDIFSGAKIQPRDFTAKCPYIPPALRPKHALKNYFLLWEASWVPAVIPHDPYLLRPVTGSLMEIVAEWDLSPLEVAAVSAAMRRV